MTIRHWMALCAGAAGTMLLPQALASAPADAEVQRQIRASIAAYSGSCPCPYSVDRGGRRCGARSAHTKPGGAAPLCYPADVRRRR